MIRFVLLVIIAIVAIVGGLFYWSMWDRVDPGNAGILLNYCDGTQEVITHSKLVFVDPRCQRLAEYSMAEHTYNMTVASGPKEAPNDAVQCVMSDQQKMAIDSTTAWQVKSDSINDLYRRRPGVPLIGNAGNSIETLIVRSEVRAGIYQSCTKYTWEYVYGAGRNEFENDAESIVRARLDVLGIQVNNFSIRGVDPDDALEAMVAARREGQKSVEATQFAAKQAENLGAEQLAKQKAAAALQIQQGVDAYALQQAQARASATLQEITATAALKQEAANAEQAQLRAHAEATKKNLETTAEATRVRELGLAEAEANKAKSSSVTQQMVDLEKWKKWDGRMPSAGNVVNTTGPVAVPSGNTP
jgi:regulator of protease activity HflC (stomatin/prohibitin superfamily)